MLDQAGSKSGLRVVPTGRTRGAERQAVGNIRGCGCSFSCAPSARPRSAAAIVTEDGPGMTRRLDANLHRREAACPNIHRARVCSPVHPPGRRLRAFPVQLMGTSLEGWRSSRSRASSSRRPPDERDGARVGAGLGGGDKVVSSAWVRSRNRLLLTHRFSSCAFLETRALSRDGDRTSCSRPQSAWSCPRSSKVPCRCCPRRRMSFARHPDF